MRRHFFFRMPRLSFSLVGIELKSHLCLPERGLWSMTRHIRFGHMENLDIQRCQLVKVQIQTSPSDASIQFHLQHFIKLLVVSSQSASLKKKTCIEEPNNPYLQWRDLFYEKMSSLNPRVPSFLVQQPYLLRMLAGQVAQRDSHLLS